MIKKRYERDRSQQLEYTYTPPTSAVDLCVLLTRLYRTHLFWSIALWKFAKHTHLYKVAFIYTRAISAYVHNYHMETLNNIVN